MDDPLLQGKTLPPGPSDTVDFHEKCFLYKPNTSGGYDVQVYRVPFGADVAVVLRQVRQNHEASIKTPKRPENKFFVYRRYFKKCFENDNRILKDAHGKNILPGQRTISEIWTLNIGNMQDTFKLISENRINGEPYEFDQETFISNVKKSVAILKERIQREQERNRKDRIRYQIGVSKLNRTIVKRRHNRVQFSLAHVGCE
jgi:hypothetical protein